LPKPDAPPKSVVADCVDGSREITRLPPVSASSRRAPALGFAKPMSLVVGRRPQLKIGFDKVLTRCP
jgi:hypothetical protein